VPPALCCDDTLPLLLELWLLLLLLLPLAMDFAVTIAKGEAIYRSGRSLFKYIQYKLR
jgi:hypothetical protein